jgi:hypothetical protein
MRKLVFLIFTLLFFISADATVFKTIGRGNWEDTAVWSGGNIPGTTFHDTVQIDSCVFINENILIEDQGLLVIGDSGKLCGHRIMRLEPGSEFDLYGRIYLDSLFSQGYIYMPTLWTMIIENVHVFPPGSLYAPLGYHQAYYFFICYCDYDSIPQHQPPPPPDSTSTDSSDTSDTSESIDTVQIDVGPNPFSDWMYVKVRGVIDDVYLTDDIGRLLLKRKFESNELQLGFLSPGIYFLNFKVADGRIFTKKIVKGD